MEAFKVKGTDLPGHSESVIVFVAEICVEHLSARGTLFVN